MRILLIEDNPGDANLIRQALAELQMGGCQLDCVSCMADARNVLGEKEIDLVLLDLSLPDSQGLDGVKSVHEIAPDTPIIVLTGLGDEADAMRALKTGVQDYLFKKDLELQLVPRAVRYAIERHRILRDIEDRLHQEETTRELDGVQRLVKTPTSPVSSQLLGSQRLEEAMPQEFKRLADEFQKIVDDSLEEQIYRVERNVSARLREMANDLGSYAAGPRDILDVYTAAVGERLDTAIEREKAYAFAAEARMRLVELMGSVVSFYRPYYSGFGPAKSD